MDKDKLLEQSGVIPPQNLEAEVSVLGSILLDKDAILKVADMIRPDDFYKNSHGVIFKAMLELYEKGDPIDLVTLSNKLEAEKSMDKVGGASYLASLANSVPSAAHVVNYSKIVSDKSVLSRLIGAANDIEALCYEGSEDVATVLDKAEQVIFQVSKKHTRENFVELKNILEESFERLDDLHKNKDKLRGAPTGFGALDNILAGLQNSDLIIIAGRPSSGKSSLALNIAQNVATNEGIPVAVFSLEMSKDQLGDRLLSAEAGIDGWKLRTGNLSDDDFPKIGEAMARLSESPIFLDDTAAINVLEMKTKARRLQSEHGLGLIIVDYLQLMHSRGQENRVQEISEISRALKGLARELNVPIIALSQLSRALESRPSKIPMLSDLRESGSIEQDADVVLMIYREDYYDPDTERKNIADILVRKHRNGPIGSVELYFQPERMQFRNLDKKRES
ncbi:replicative DNA helicase [bacterium (Candidatus Howlettbacteria) CG_4_10_14_0_8_um_filter_40_9]|nr:MAG: replicative DNA helicase [bacterium (Candidatus Howlettbacteria) CG_4_10_14_0_8_um_filter_40_9]